MDKRAKFISVTICELITTATVVYLAVKGKFDSGFLLCCVTLLLVLLPSLFERLFKCKMWTPLYIFGVLYAIGPMLGHSLNFYYMFPGWDKILHISGGIMFAVVGIFLFKVLVGRDNHKLIATAVFALCFSMAVSMAWEFYEFGSDHLFGTDTQDDMIITSITSHTLNDTMGNVGTIDDIESVIINGQEMDWNGYLDIGLTDTMLDMILETLGAVVIVAIFLIDKGKHPMIDFQASF